MGVDIAFHIEVRRKDKWHAFVWQTPAALAEYSKDEDEGGRWQNHMCCYCCRYYHFQDLIEDSPSSRSGLPEDCSEEIRKKIEDYEPNGYINFEDVIHFCDEAEKNMLFNLTKSKECQTAKALRRIEKLLRQKPIPKTLEADNDCYSNMSLKEIYEEYLDEVAYCSSLRDIVCALLDDYYSVSASDVRLVYCLC